MGPRMAPIWSQDGCETAPRRTKTAQDGPKTAPRRPQDSPKTAQDGVNIAPNSFERFQDGVKTAQTTPRCFHDGPLWRQDRHFAARWLLDGPRWSQDGLEMRVVRNQQFLKDLPREMLTFGCAQDRPEQFVTFQNGPRQGLQAKNGPAWSKDGSELALRRPQDGPKWSLDDP